MIGFRTKLEILIVNAAVIVLTACSRAESPGSGSAERGGAVAQRFLTPIENAFPRARPCPCIRPSRGVWGDNRLHLGYHSLVVYRSGESVFHMLWEMHEWLEKYDKNAPPRKPTSNGRNDEFPRTFCYLCKVATIRV